MGGWGKLSDKTFEGQQIIILLEYHRFDWPTAYHTPNSKVQTFTQLLCMNSISLRAL